MLTNHVSSKYVLGTSTSRFPPCTIRRVYLRGTCHRLDFYEKIRVWQLVDGDRGPRGAALRFKVVLVDVVEPREVFHVDEEHLQTTNTEARAMIG